MKLPQWHPRPLEPQRWHVPTDVDDPYTINYIFRGSNSNPNEQDQKRKRTRYEEEDGEQDGEEKEQVRDVEAKEGEEEEEEQVRDGEDKEWEGEEEEQVRDGEDAIGEGEEEEQVRFTHIDTDTAAPKRAGLGYGAAYFALCLLYAHGLSMAMEQIPMGAVTGLIVFVLLASLGALIESLLRKWLHGRNTVAGEGVKSPQAQAWALSGGLGLLVAGILCLQQQSASNLAAAVVLGTGVCMGLHQLLLQTDPGELTARTELLYKGLQTTLYCGYLVYSNARPFGSPLSSIITSMYIWCLFVTPLAPVNMQNRAKCIKIPTTSPSDPKLHALHQQAAQALCGVLVAAGAMHYVTRWQ